MSEEEFSQQNDVEQAVRQETRSLWRRNMLRFVVGLIILVVIVVVIGAIAYSSYRSSRGKPIKVGVYPGVQQITDEVIYAGYDHQQYLSGDPIEQIEAFYNNRNGLKCERQYDYRQEPALYLFTSCIVDRSSLNMTQYTKVVIQPAMDDAGNPTGQVVIDVQRHWEE